MSKPEILKAKTKLPLFGGILHIFVADNIGSVFDLFEARGSLFEPPHDMMGACAYSDHNGNFGLVFKNDSLAHDVIAHEIFHVAVLALDFYGLKCDSHNHETYAYMAGWITSFVYKFLEKNFELMETTKLINSFAKEYNIVRPKK